MVECLPPFNLVLFLEFYPVLSFGKFFFVSSFCLLPCVCFYGLGRSATFPSLGSLDGFPFGCVICGSNWVVLWCALKPDTECVGLGPLGRDSGTSLVSCCLCLAWGYLVRATKLSWVGAACAGFGGTWGRLCCKLRLSVTGARLGAS